MKKKPCFVVFTDTHIATGRSDGLWWNRMLLSKSCEILKRAVCDINKMKPDLVVHCGDLTDASDEKSFRLAKKLLDGLSARYCTTVALMSYPNEFRVIMAAQDQIEVITQPLSDSKFYQESYVEE